MDHKTLLTLAEEAREKAYAPYSGFSVGAALLCEDGEVFTGCNIENASFTPTCCAERVAIFSAVKEGKRRFSAIAVVGNENPCYPCGVCRQVLSEFCDGELPVLLKNEEGSPVTLTLNNLLPHRFRL